MAGVVKPFAGRHPFVGPTLWVLSVQYFFVQIATVIAWKTHYSLFSNSISDLGNTACGMYGGRLVCSPLHGLMNASFILLGATMYIGAVLIYQEFRKSPAAAAGFNFLALSGVGTLLVGLFPENTVGGLHILGAALGFAVGNIGLVILSLVPAFPRPLRFYTFLSGVISLAALVLLLTNNYLGLGIGGIERITAYPQTLWLIIFGLYMFRKRTKKRPVHQA